jgi:hypothetical protein
LFFTHICHLKGKLLLYLNSIILITLSSASSSHSTSLAKSRSAGGSERPRDDLLYARGGT